MKGKLEFLKKGPTSSGFLVAMFVLGFILLPSEWIGKLLGIPGDAAVWTGLTAMRVVGAVLAILAIQSLGFRILGLPGAGRAALLTLPFWMVAVNNAPLIGLAAGSVSIDAKAWELVVYVAMCLSIALFEECAVRGVVFPLFLLGAKRSKWGVLWAILLSSAVFGLLHLVNLLGGASLGAVILQVGYTFLIGAMCGLVLVVTRSIWWCVGIHFVYDIGGLMSGNILSAGSVLWDTPTVVLTAVLSVLVVGYGLFVFWKSDSVAAAGELLGGPFAPSAGDAPTAEKKPPAEEKPLVEKESSEGGSSAGDGPSVGEEPPAEKKPPVDPR